MGKQNGLKLPLAAILLVAICAIGLISSGQQYFLLRAVEDALKTHKAVDESFVIAVNAGTIGLSSLPNGVAKAVQNHMEQTADVRQTISQLRAGIETIGILSAGLWLTALVVLVTAFFRKRGTPSRRGNALDGEER
jgi:hypothetical protein